MISGVNVASDWLVASLTLHTDIGGLMWQGDFIGCRPCEFNFLTPIEKA
jgi:hypothetical protein